MIVVHRTFKLKGGHIDTGKIKLKTKHQLHMQTQQQKGGVSLQTTGEQETVFVIQSHRNNDAQVQVTGYRDRGAKVPTEITSKQTLH